jgi:hypothetical protein
MWFILVGVRSDAGTSTRTAYRSASSERRRAAIAATGLATIAACLGWAANHARGTGAEVVAVLAIGAAACAACAALACRRAAAGDAERWLRAANGEAATSAQLDRLSDCRWFVRHDLAIPGSHANIDHLVIGPSGVWVIDTKTTRAEVRARWRTVHFGTRRLDAGSVRWEAEVVGDRLGVLARPLIVVHGGLQTRRARCGAVRVVPPSRVVHHLRWKRPRLDRNQIAELADQAERVFRPWSMVAKAGQQ